ncbi:hypothetical protein ElyMa_000639700 [Elysia marginata]|uniref:SUEL-type lectin domain-containing protein n=1 Tax=Elysia marginata TaxID=1093978 RepID=A0AAV4GD80_9GAST|nr:hypothetical protein ElyMa_000639700 [Elysia marginata]
MACPDGTLINLQSAIYSLEDPSKNPRCSPSKSVKQHLERRIDCIIEKDCNFIISNTLLGDICRGAKKILQVRYTCMRCGGTGKSWGKLLSHRDYNTAWLGIEPATSESRVRISNYSATLHCILPARDDQSTVSAEKTKLLEILRFDCPRQSVRLYMLKQF